MKMRILNGLACFALVCASQLGWAQGGIETWIGDDPGAGNGTFHSGSSPLDLSIETSALEDGLHRIGIRPKTDDGLWGLPFFIWLRVEDNDAYQITSAEYFWDTDPGQGAGASLDLAAFQAGEATLLTDGLDYGVHTMGLRFQTAQGMWSVPVWDTLEICTNFNVLPGFTLEVFGRNVYPQSTTQHHNTMAWIVDGLAEEADSSEYPALSLKPGDHVVSQTAWNECDTVVTTEACHVFGISSVHTSLAPQGDLYMPRIVGAFDSTTTVWLTRDGYDIHTDSTLLISGSQMDVFFTIPPDAAGGDWDLVSMSSSSIADTVQAAVEIDAPFYDLTGEMSGPGAIRRNVWTPFTYSVTNNGNIPAYGTPCIILIEGDIIGSIETVDFMPQEVLDSNAVAFSLDPLSYLVEHAFMQYYDTTMQDSASVSFLMLPPLLPGQTTDIEFFVMADEDDEGPLSISAGVGLPWMEEANGYRMAGGTCDIFGPCFDAAKNFMSIIPGVGCFTGGWDLGCAAQDCVKDGGGSKCAMNMSLAMLQLATCWSWGSSKAAYEAGAAVLGIGFRQKSIIDGLMGGAGGGGGADCGCIPTDDCGGSDGQGDVVVAVDPNEKTGPLGWDESRWIPGSTDRFAYQISCENADSATAPAAEVRMVDSLDLDVFIPNTLTFTSLSFGDSIAEIEEGDLAFVLEFDLQPEKNAVLQVAGQVDTLSGIVTVTWRSLDPVTRNLTYEIEAGFLNPNVTAPEGEAFVTFTIDVMSEAANHDAFVDNAAHIFFDGNAPIATPIWSNRFDLMSPEADITGAQANGDWSSVLLTADVSDVGSGVRFLDVFRDSTDNGVFVQPLLIGRFGYFDDVQLPIDPNVQHHLFTRAVDGVGNMEDMEPWDDLSALNEWLYVPIVCPGDYNGNHYIDVSDLVEFLTAYGSENSPEIDLTQDQMVGCDDLLVFLQNFSLDCN